MTRRTKAEWQAVILAQQESGLSAAAFCREREIKANYFCRVRNQLRLSNVEKQVSDFVPVSVSRSSVAERITIRCEAGATVELPYGIEPRWVAQLLLALRD
jgi:hypothetical protein